MIPDQRGPTLAGQIIAQARVLGGQLNIEIAQTGAKATPFAIKMLQSDNGSEFSRTFSERAKIEHRHSRVRRPNDNAHLERFNRTIQDECLDALPKDTKVINRNLPKYLRYYNGKRHHFGLNLQTPLQVVRSY